MKYALLLAPSANRVYAEAAGQLAVAELAAFGAAVLAAEPGEIAETQLGGVGYLTFTVPGGGLTERDVAYLSNLSSGYALFELVGAGLLRPVPLRPLAWHDDDLITIPKYAGKTNEQFTRLLLNVTLLASASAPVMLDRPLTVLDPLCGRGTTLNQALRYGHHAIGIEVDGKDVDTYAAFLRTWLRRKRIKHSADLHPVRRDRRLVARCFEAAVGDRRHGEPQRVTVYHADTTHARDFLRAGCADAVVADTPYGVVHGSRAPGPGGRAGRGDRAGRGGRAGGADPAATPAAAGGPAGSGQLSRRPLDLLRAAVPVWAQLLRAGGAAGISWNIHVARREELAKVFVDAGLVPVDTPAYRGFEHWVDQAVTRDILVARKP